MISKILIREVRAEIKRFNSRLEDFEKRELIEKELSSYPLTLSGCKETGALRRASMDLSNVLVKFRKFRGI